MGKRTYETDIAAMALLYRYQCDGSMMLSYDKIEKFDEVINKNLDGMNSSCGIGVRYEEEPELYFTIVDENGKKYAVMNKTADINKARSYHIGVLPTDIIIASQMPNALEIIGLKLDKGDLKKITFPEVMSLEEVIEKVIESPRKFYIKIAEVLSIEEREYIKTFIEDKSCINCSNMSCNVNHLVDNDHISCVSWDNKEMIGRQKVLSSDHRS